MMIDPLSYLDDIKAEKKSYVELIQERNRLFSYLKNYEYEEMTESRDEREWSICPNPQVRYQMYMEYLSQLLLYMKEVYNEEYVWGGKTLATDNGLEDREDDEV